jgi:hypothetical protein
MLLLQCKFGPRTGRALTGRRCFPAPLVLSVPDAFVERGSGRHGEDINRTRIATATWRISPNLSAGCLFTEIYGRCARWCRFCREPRVLAHDALDVGIIELTLALGREAHCRADRDPKRNRKACEASIWRTPRDDRKPLSAFMSSHRAASPQSTARSSFRHRTVSRSTANVSSKPTTPLSTISPRFPTAVFLYTVRRFPGASRVSQY